MTNVTPGDHNATIIYKDGNNNTSEFNTTVTIPKWDSTVNATSINIREGDVATITINVGPANATGVVLVDINGKGYYVNVTDGKATLEVEGLKAGDYTARVTYLGNEYYNNSTAETTFKVSKAITINTNGTGNNTCIVIDLPENTTGNVTVIIDNQTYYVGNNTNGTVTIPVNATPGDHNITVIYVDNNGTTSVVNDTFTVDLYETPISIEVSDALVGDTVKVTVKVPNDVTGNVTIEIDGEIYSTKADKGIAEFEVTGLLSGNKTVTATYAGDNVYGFNSTTAEFTVSKHPAPISVNVDNSTEGKVTVSVTLPEGATGYVIVKVKGTDYGINLTAGEKSVIIPIKSTGDYTATVTYLGDYKYLDNSTSKGFKATGEKPSEGTVSVEVNDTPSGKDVEVKVTVPEGSTGKVNVTIDNVTKEVNVTGGENIIKVPGVSEGSHDVKVTYTDDATGETETITKTITVFKSIVADKNMKRGWNSPYDYKAEFLDNEGHILKNTDVQFVVNGKTYTVKTDNQGIAYLDANLRVGKYDITVINPVTGDTVNATTTIVKRIIDNKDITMDFLDGHSYVVRAIGDDGKPVGAGEVVGFRVHGVEYNGITDKNGYARLKINLNPKKYTITAQYRAYKVSNKIVVKQTLKLVKKTVKVKKSAKKLVIKAKLKWSNGKAIKGKKLKLKFRGKTYTAKTNKKGIAKFTIKKKVLKKLKAGKKYKYSVRYQKNIVKGKVKVKK